jgi:hypothetical protein
VSYLDDLSRELGAVGIRGARRRRILAEVEDHLQESHDAAAFGDPALIAQRFADELATPTARRAAFRSVAALAPAGLAFAGLFVSDTPGPDITSARTLGVGIAAAAAIVLAPQVAFAAGLLAALRAWRLRGVGVAPAAEVVVLRRRVGVALAAGSTTMLALALYAYEYSAGLSTAWIAAAFAASAGALVPILVVGCETLGLAKLRPTTAGAAGDITADVRTFAPWLPRFLATPWRICLSLCLLAAVAALVAAGPDEGARNAAAEVVAICAGFGGLGRYLGLRTSRVPHCSHGSA